MFILDIAFWALMGISMLFLILGAVNLMCNHGSRETGYGVLAKSIFGSSALMLLALLIIQPLNQTLIDRQMQTQEHIAAFTEFVNCKFDGQIPPELFEILTETVPIGGSFLIPGTSREQTVIRLDSEFFVLLANWWENNTNLDYMLVLQLINNGRVNLWSFI